MRNLAFALLLTLAPAAAAASDLAVPLDEAVRITLPVPASDVIVGNPTIADVSVADRRHLVITGKANGVTNLLVADATGRTILNREIVVSASNANRVSVFSGPLMQNYACAPSCTPLSGQGSGAAGAAAGSAATP